jgi:hypothetical protein
MSAMLKDDGLQAGTIDVKVFAYDMNGKPLDLNDIQSASSIITLGHSYDRSAAD